MVDQTRNARARYEYSYPERAYHSLQTPTVLVVIVTPQHEQALLYREVGAQADAYGGTVELDGTERLV